MTKISTWFIEVITKGPTLYKQRIRDDKLLIVWMVVLILIRIWLVQAQDLIATSTPHDDYLFIKLARHILNGEWLGPYDQFTLIKGPGFPLFIAAAHLAGIPLMLAEHLLYSLFCVITILAIKPLFHKRWPLMAIFLFLLFNPFMYLYPATGRVFRFSITMPLVLAVFASGVGLVTRASGTFIRLLCWASVFGSCFTYLWFTREEGIWMLPALLLLAIYFLVVENRHSQKQYLQRISCLVWVFLIFMGAKTILENLNNHYYGAPVIVELKTPQFQSALGGLMAIDGLGSTRFLPVSWRAQKAGFAVSQCLKELEACLPEQKNKAKQMNSFYIWLFRDMVRKSGNAETLPEALEFYDSIGRELAQACNDGRLNCLDRKPTIRPVWKQEYNALLPAALWEVFHKATSFNRLQMEKNDFRRWTTTAEANQVRDFKFVTLEHLTPGHKHHIAGYPKFYKRLIENKFRILSDISSFYRSSVPYLFGLAVIFNIAMFIVAIVEKRSLFYPVIGLIIVTGIFSLVAILSYIKITLWPINRPLMAAYMLILFYISLMISISFQELIALKQNKTTNLS